MSTPAIPAWAAAKWPELTADLQGTESLRALRERYPRCSRENLSNWRHLLRAAPVDSIAHDLGGIPTDAFEAAVSRMES